MPFRPDAPGLSIVDVADILLVAYLVYRLLAMIRGTRAWRILGGIVVFILALYASSALRLNTLHWVLDKATLLAPVALVILLLPELRQALETVGKIGLWPQVLPSLSEPAAEAQTVEEIVAAVSEMASARVGALIVLERTASLDEIIANGVPLDAKVTAPALGAIFYPGNPLHDGAAIIRGDRIVAAACRLPLSESERLDANVHMRHRAAVGVTEALDCLCVVVSEERGTISLAADGRLRRLGSHLELREILNTQFRGVSAGRKNDRWMVPWKGGGPK
ncbi:MAG: diadenylate cyclase CdaA [Armatimonadetes bacterium]|nr:diadenylate cyclase CdaA [Armatimonadota bacterium]MCA1997075.1 diadenylate cyclase CdaA [Armatimonadota bacterium]